MARHANQTLRQSEQPGPLSRCPGRTRAPDGEADKAALPRVSLNLAACIASVRGLQERREFYRECGHRPRKRELLLELHRHRLRLCQSW